MRYLDRRRCRTSISGALPAAARASILRLSMNIPMSTGVRRRRDPALERVCSRRRRAVSDGSARHGTRTERRRRGGCVARAVRKRDRRAIRARHVRRYTSGDAVARTVGRRGNDRAARAGSLYRAGGGCVGAFSVEKLCDALFGRAGHARAMDDVAVRCGPAGETVLSSPARCPRH